MMAEDEDRRGIGEVLAAARRGRGLSIAEVAKDTKIRTKYLEALEAGDFASIPGDIYARGFIKTYAEYLGLDHRPLLKQYKVEYDHPVKFDSRLQPKAVDAKSERSKRSRMALVAIACLLVLVYWGASASRKTADEQIKAQRLNKTPTSQKVTTPSNAPTTTKPSGIELQITATGEEGCWLAATADGQTVFEGTIPKGQTQKIKGAKVITLNIGNAGGVVIKQNGKDIGSLGEVGAVVQKTFTVEGR